MSKIKTTTVSSTEQQERQFQYCVAINDTFYHRCLRKELADKFVAFVNPFAWIGCYIITFLLLCFLCVCFFFCKICLNFFYFFFNTAYIAIALTLYIVFRIYKMYYLAAVNQVFVTIYNIHWLCRCNVELAKKTCTSFTFIFWIANVKNCFFFWLFENTHPTCRNSICFVSKKSKNKKTTKKTCFCFFNHSVR